MRSAYSPAPSLAAGKRYRPSRSVTTVVVMVDPARFTPTRTPSIGPSSVEETRPVSAGPAPDLAAPDWAWTGRWLTGESARAAPTTDRSRNVVRMRWIIANLQSI